MTTEPWAGVRERALGLGWLADPLTEAELADLEAQAGVRLPEEYRDFLLRVGAGGTGPQYGVFPARRAEGGQWRWDGDGGHMTVLDRLAEPFPVRGPDPEVPAALEAERPEEEDFEDIEDFDAAWEAWDERTAGLLWTEDRTVGAICLCHVGCAERRWLVVSGPERGRIWADARCDDVDLEPLRGPDGEPLTFASWYLSWLDEASREVVGGTA
ncbi:hypothetical protein GCM10020367_35260 [Streptomyces sannanensis]|uniref:Knr4/Smi1-like domain-containing protein n=1 Tax=Streptomyces sannanensis TaxID=285536 RepID=A0ABP6SD62_9ACTN